LSSPAVEARSAAVPGRPIVVRDSHRGRSRHLRRPDISTRVKGTSSDTALPRTAHSSPQPHRELLPQSSGTAIAYCGLSASTPHGAAGLGPDRSHRPSGSITPRCRCHLAGSVMKEPNPMRARRSMRGASPRTPTGSWGGATGPGHEVLITATSVVTAGVVNAARRDSP